jgi:hypothetical protein
VEEDASELPVIVGKVLAREGLVLVTTTTTKTRTVVSVCARHCCSTFTVSSGASTAGRLRSF